ncbi:MAG TPA: hypothetical protein PK725_16055 [Rhodocyclaceae bacterium]|jgi:hypothetical protein|nr:hypothetical protein [Rhodocyclaceae bacterium]
MKMREHVVIPLESALRLRDAAIRYGILKAGQWVSLAIAVAAAIVGTAAMQFEWPAVLWGATAACLIGFGGAYWVSRQLEYPHFPRVAEEELEEMREIGIPAAVVKRTECSVLVGSLAELDAMKMSGEIIARLRRRSAK